MRSEKMISPAVSSPVDVIYIAGAGRSGTTILQRVLSKAENIFEAGELRHIWMRGFRDNQLCGCSSKFRSCDFWRKVIEEAFPCTSNEEILSEVSMYMELFDFRTLLLAGTRGRSEKISEFCSTFLYPLYSSIASNTSQKLIIDSSKTPAYLLLLQKCPGINLKVIHLVRDSRAVSYSWQKRKLRPEISGKKAYMPHLPPHSSASIWLLSNLAIELLKKKTKTDYVRVLYEDFVADPAGTVESLFEFMGVADDVGSILSGNKVMLEPAHSVSGNPMRFDKGIVTLKSDDSWRNEMNKYDRFCTSLLTWPLLLTYY